MRACAWTVCLGLAGAHTGCHRSTADRSLEVSAGGANSAKGSSRSLDATVHTPEQGSAVDAQTDAKPHAIDAPQPSRIAPPSPETAGTCPSIDDPTIGLLVSPQHPAVGGSVRILAASFSSEPLALRIDVQPSSGAAAPATITPEIRGGQPVSSFARWTPERAGTYRVVAGRMGTGLRCFTLHVMSRTTRRDPRPIRATGLWPTGRAWSEGEEALYGAWIREMFHADPGQEIAFSTLDQVTSDPQRNVLHDHYGWNEDRPPPAGLFLKPDCADTPYFFRAYYSWKRGLPFGFRSCTSGRPGVAPSCGDVHPVAPRFTTEATSLATTEGANVGGRVDGGTVAGAETRSEERPDLKRLLERPRRPGKADDRKAGELAAVQDFFTRTLAGGVHTGNGRTAFGNNASDFYTVGLTPHGLRAGTIYADPYGHILTLVELIPPAGGRPGVLYAVDGQPDGSITRKRFWEGNFLFNPDPALGGSGFKAFRPLVLRARPDEQRLVALRDDEIARQAGYGDASREQAEISPEQFYDRMERIITPGVRDPFIAQEEEARAFSEAARVRVTSVSNGQKYFAAHPGGTIEMPTGDGIFEASGPWEDYSTPARDLRLLIAMHVVSHFDDKLGRSPQAFGVDGAAALDALKAKLAAAREALLRSTDLGIRYTRSDGSGWALTLADLMERKAGFEVAYNPNDCPEVRWAAPAGSPEMSTCNRRAPEAQQRKLEAYRIWFRDRRRPPRGDPGPKVR